MNKTQKTILIILLILLSLAIRLQNTHQTDFDSYWLHAQAESIQTHESALWVYHPTSLFGYYPLSYPSGTMFFLAIFSELTGLSMNMTVFASSLAVGLLVIFFTFLITKEIFNKWTWGYIAGLTVSLSPIIINYSSFNAGGRIFIMPFYLLFIWSLIKWHKEKKWSYLLVAAASLVFAFLVHRTAQFIIIFILAFFGAWCYQKIPSIWKYIREHRHFKKHIYSRYEKSKYYLLIDLGILFLIALIAKIGDLIARNRLGLNVQSKIVEPSQAILEQSASQYIFIAFFTLLLVIAVVHIVMLYYKKVNIFKKSFDIFHHHYHSIFERPERYFLLILGLFTLFLFVRQFFGQSFYAPSIEDFQATELISGSGPIVIFLNMVINYTTSVTPIFLFGFLGYVYLLYKKERDFTEWFLIFSFIAFSGVLLDKRYVKMFIVPFWSIFIVAGWFWFTSILRRKILNNKIFINIIHIIIILILLLGSFSTYLRQEYLDEEKPYAEQEYYWQTGQYIRTLGNDFSTITTTELQAGVIIFASSGVPGGSHNVYYFVDEDKLIVQSLTFQEVKDKALNGQKIENVWFLNDWIFGGRYYIGRHTIYLFRNEFHDKINQIIIKDYNEKYYIHDYREEKNRFYQSILPVKNKLYANPSVDVHDILRGRE